MTRQFAPKIVRDRSRIVHGTWSTAGTIAFDYEVPATAQTKIRLPSGDSFPFKAYQATWNSAWRTLLVTFTIAFSDLHAAHHGFFPQLIRRAFRDRHHDFVAPEERDGEGRVIGEDRWAARRSASACPRAFDRHIVQPRKVFWPCSVCALAGQGGKRSRRI